MAEKKVYRAIGLMSGTSLDGVDVALLETDGFSQIKPLAFESYPYDDTLRAAVKAGFGKPDKDLEAEKLVTDAHIKAVQDFGQEADVIGFHGQTVFHDPDNGVTVQLGDGERLAKETGMDVVYDFRKSDVAAGGQGAPLIPLYHWGRVVAEKLPLPVAVVNIGGVSNVTWVGQTDVLAFDCGPGNALIDDYMMKHLGKPYDEGGALALSGALDFKALEYYMSDPFFDRPAPKSLDRDHWSLDPVRGLDERYVAATLAAFTARAIAAAVGQFPQEPQEWFVTGGGRHNKAIMERLEEAVGTVRSVDDLGWSGDALEAEGFAYLAVRSLLGAPISLPKTTGVPKPMTGGVLARC